MDPANNIISSWIRLYKSFYPNEKRVPSPFSHFHFLKKSALPLYDPIPHLQDLIRKSQANVQHYLHLGLVGLVLLFPNETPRNLAQLEALWQRCRKFLLLLLYLYSWILEILARWQKALFLLLISEFPNRLRPPCTTMPWTIWPALVVLWGVCWMFYDNCDQIRNWYDDFLTADDTSNVFATDHPKPDLDYDSDFINSLLAIDTSNFDYFVTTNQQQYGLSQTPQVMQNDFSPPSLPAKAIRTANTPFTTHGEDDTFSGFDPVVYPSIDNTSITQHQETTTATTETAPTVSTTPSPFLQPATSNQTKVTRNSRHSEIEQYFCRYPTCKRSQPGSGFKRKDHLDQHLRGVHKETTVSRIRAYPAVKSRSEASSHDATAGKKRKRESDEEIELARIKEELAEERKLRMVVEAENKVLRQKLEIIRGVIKGDGEEWNRNIYD